MAILELSSQQFADQINKSLVRAQAIIQSRVWKDKATKKQYTLMVIEKKSEHGLPKKFVLWDTELNQPIGDVNESRDVQYVSPVLQGHGGESSVFAPICSKRARQFSMDAQKEHELNQPATERTGHSKNHPLPATPSRTAGRRTELEPTSSNPLADTEVSTFFAPAKPMSFKQLAKNAENNAQKRDNTRFDALLDQLLPETSYVEPDAHQAVSRLLQPANTLPMDNAVGEMAAIYQNQPLADSAAERSDGGDSKIAQIAANQDFHPESFDCQMHYVLRLIERQGLGKVCKSTVLTAYFATVYIHESIRAEWNALTNNAQRSEFAQKHHLVGTIPSRLKAEGNPKSITGRKSTVPPEAVEWIIKKVHDWADDNAEVLTATRRRTDFLLKTLLKKHLGIVLSEKQVFTIVKNHNLRQLMDKPQGTAGKKVGKKKGTYPRLPVNNLWLMDGCVPELLYIRGANGNYTKLTCIGIEDVGSRKLLGFREYYSESGSSSVNLFKQVMTENQFKKGTSEPQGLISPTLRPDKGSGFMTSMGACAFAIGKAYAEKYHFSIDFKEANAGSPTEKAHLESSWKSVHSTYVGLVQDYFTLLGKVDKTPIVSNFKRGIEMSALYLDITLEELRASCIGGEFMRLMNSRKRTFTEDNKTIDFVPDHRWARYLAGLNNDDQIMPPPPDAVFSADDEAMEILNVFGYAKHDANVKPDMTIQYKVGYNVPRDLGFSVTRSTPVRVSEMPDGTGRLAIFTAKEKQTKTKHDFGAEFLGFATVKAIGGNEEKAKHIRAKKDQKMAQVLEIAKQGTAYSLILKEIQPFLSSFGTESEQKMLNNLVTMKLTPELARLWIFDLCLDKETGEATLIEFGKFSLDARKRLQNVLIMPSQKRNLR